MATQTQKNRQSRQSKAAQDRAAREAKAKAAEEQASPEEQVDEATTPEGTEPTSEQVDDEASSEEQVEQVDDEWFTDLPKIRQSNGGGSVWTDRLNEVAEAIGADPSKAGAYKTIHTAPSPRTANTTAASVRRKMKDGELGGLLPGTFTIVCRGSKILATFAPDPANDEEGSPEA